MNTGLLGKVKTTPEPNNGSLRWIRTNQKCLSPKTCCSCCFLGLQWKLIKTPWGPHHHPLSSACGRVHAPLRRRDRSSEPWLLSQQRLPSQQAPPRLRASFPKLQQEVDVFYERKLITGSWNGFQENPAWHFDGFFFFCKEMPVLLALAPPIVCTRPCSSTNLTRLGAQTIRGNFAVRCLWAAANKLTSHSSTLACLPAVLKQLEDASRSSFGSWITHFHFRCRGVHHKPACRQTHRKTGGSWASSDIHTDRNVLSVSQKWTTWWNNADEIESLGFQ